MSDHATLTVLLPRDVRERARAVAKRTRITTTHLIRVSLLEKVEFYEAKFRAEEERKRQEKYDKRMGMRGMRDLQSPTPGPLAPAPPTPISDDSDEETTDPLDAVYAAHAARLLAVLDRPILEKRLAVAEAIADVKRRAPLTHPSDEEIRRGLERCVLALQAERQPPPAATVLATPPSPLAVVEEKLDEVAVSVLDRLAGRPVNARKTQVAGETPKAEGE